MYEWLVLSSSADLKKISQFIPAEFDPDRVTEKLSKGLSNGVRAILIEANYTDKDYRSTYYRFYAKKGQRYGADCVRLHFFDQTVTFDEKLLKLRSSGGTLSHHYYGYMVLRPTGIATIGRSVVSPDVRSDPDRANPWFTITADHKVHLLGEKLTVQGFPSMDQHVDIAVCAHVACWAILRHNSERYSNYREYLTHDVTMMAQQFNPGGLVPSRGLQVSHAERILQEAGTFPLVIPKDKTSPDAFYQQLNAYVESGFPLFAVMPALRHAIAVIGYERRKPVTTTPPTRMRHAWEEVKSLVVVDDNHLPYLSIPVTQGTYYSAGDIDAFIVALPDGIYYPAEAVLQLAPILFSFSVALGLPSKGETILRYFVTTGAAFRHFVRSCESEFDPKLLNRIMTLPYAQFVWIIEFATEAQWAGGQISARAVVDATASLHEANPLWLFHSSSSVLSFGRKSIFSPKDPFRGAESFHIDNSFRRVFTRMDQTCVLRSPSKEEIEWPRTRVEATSRIIQQMSTGKHSKSLSAR